LAVGWVSAVRRRAVQELRRAREEFEAKVVERTADLQRNEAYLAQAQKLTHTGSWAWDPSTEKVLYCSEEMFRIFGLDPRESSPSRDNFRQQIHPEDRDWVKERFEESLRERLDTFAEYRVLLPDGTVRHISASGHPVLNEDGKLIEFIGTATDATERKRLEERLRVQHTVALILAEAATIEEATPRILRAMGECLGWDVGALWRVDREAEALRCVELWHRASIAVPEFERASREFTFVPGLGLPGRVWSSLEPEYIPDVVPDENFPRVSIAEREGLHAAFGFPILLRVFQPRDQAARSGAAQHAGYHRQPDRSVHRA
jgi:PAS domain S-box-containing protein